VKKSRYTEEQIAFALRQAETETPVAEVIRKMGISEQTFYRWKKVYAGPGVVDVRRVKQLEEENRKLKQLVASAHQVVLWLKSGACRSPLNRGASYRHALDYVL
jgi:putative transposase